MLPLVIAVKTHIQSISHAILVFTVCSSRHTSIAKVAFVAHTLGVVLLVFVRTPCVFFGLFLYLNNVEELIRTFVLQTELLVALEDSLDFTLVMLFIGPFVFSTRTRGEIVIVWTAILAVILTVVGCVRLSLFIIEYFQVLFDGIFRVRVTFRLGFLLLVFLVLLIQKHLIDSIL